MHFKQKIAYTFFKIYIVLVIVCFANIRFGILPVYASDNGDNVVEYIVSDSEGTFGTPVRIESGITYKVTVPADWRNRQNVFCFDLYIQVNNLIKYEDYYIVSTNARLKDSYKSMFYNGSAIFYSDDRLCINTMRSSGEDLSFTITAKKISIVKDIRINMEKSYQEGTYPFEYEIIGSGTGELGSDVKITLSPDCEDDGHKPDVVQINGGQITFMYGGCDEYVKITITDKITNVSKSQLIEITPKPNKNFYGEFYEQDYCYYDYVSLKADCFSDGVHTKIYRKDTKAGEYKLIDTVDYIGLDYYTDSKSIKPNHQYWYKLQTYDVNTNTWSDFSPERSYWTTSNWSTTVTKKGNKYSWKKKDGVKYYIVSFKTCKFVGYNIFGQKLYDDVTKYYITKDTCITNKTNGVRCVTVDYVYKHGSYYYVDGARRNKNVKKLVNKTSTHRHRYNQCKKTYK